MPAITATAGGHSATVNWTYGGQNAAGFELEAEEVGIDNFHIVDTPGAGGGSETFTGLDAGQAYDFRIRVDYQDGTVSDYAEADVEIPEPLIEAGSSGVTSLYGSSGNDDPYRGSLAGLASDSDGDPISYQLVGTPVGGSVVVSADGTFTFTPTSDELTIGGGGEFAWEGIDGSGHVSNVASYSVYYYPSVPGGSPPAGYGDGLGNLSASIPNDQSLTGNTGALDPSGEDPTQWTVQQVADPGNPRASGHQITVNPDGSYAYIPPANFVGWDWFTYEDTSISTGAKTGYTTMFVQVLPSAASPIGNWSPDAGQKAPPRPATTPRAPAKVNVVLTGPGTVQVSWQNTSDNETKFVVERADNSGFANPVLISVGADQTICTDQLPTTYKKYYYKVEAQNAAGNADSNIQNVQGLALKALNYSEKGGYEAIKCDFPTAGAFGSTYDQNDRNTQWLAGAATDANPTPGLTYDSPVAYVCSAGGPTTPQIQVTFTVSPMPPGAHWMVKGEAAVSAEDVIEFPAAALKSGNLYGSSVTATVTAASALPKYILNSELDIGWYVSFNGGKTWFGAGSTDNHLYLTGAKVGQGAPPNAVVAGAVNVTAYESVMAIGCIAASYLTPGMDDSQIVSNIFGAFATLEVHHIVAGSPVGAHLTYWGHQWSGQNPLANNMEFFTAEGLLKHSDGRCNAWSDLFYQAEMAQGEAGALKFIKVLPNRPLSKGEKIFSGQQYNRIQALVVKPAAAVQGAVVDPQNVVNNHSIVLWTEPPGSAQTYTLFDASYGTATAGSGADFKTAAGIPWEHGALSAIRAYYGAGTATSQDLTLLANVNNCEFI